MKKNYFIIFLLSSFLCCASFNLNKKANEALKQKKWDLAVARFSQLCKNKPNDINCLEKFNYAKIKSAHSHYDKAQILIKNKYYEEALVELEIAADLLPNDLSIQEELKKVRNYIIEEKNQEETPSIVKLIGTEIPEAQLKLASDEPMDIQFQNVSFKIILEAIAKAVNINIIFDSDVEDKYLSLSLKKVHFLDALNLILKTTNNTYKIVNSSTILIYPDTQTKEQLYEERYVKVFFVSNAEVENIARVLRSTLGIKAVSTDRDLNLIIIKDTLKRIKAAENLIRIYDKPKPEVVIDVEIIEVNRNKAREYGLQIASANAQGIQTSLVPETEIKLDPAPILSRSHFEIVNLPSLTFRLIKSSSDAHLIASLPLRTIQGQTGRVRFGQEVPVPQTTFAPIAQGGVNQQPITSFIYRNIGINIDITPRIHIDNNVTLDVVIESSSLSGQGYGGVPVFGTSRVEKSIRLKENETSIIAGLVKEELRNAIEGIPGLSELPGIGKIFSRTSSTKGETEIILALTPHIINPIKLSPDDISPFLIKETPETAPQKPSEHIPEEEMPPERLREPLPRD